MTILTYVLIALIGANIAVCTLFVFGGAVRDVRRRRRGEQFATVRFDLARILLQPTEETTEEFQRVRKARRRVVLGAMQQLAFDLNGPSHDRLLRLADALGIDHHIRSLGRRTRWRQRCRAAQLAHLLGQDDPTRAKLLADRHPTVQAYALEGLSRSDIHDVYSLVLEMLDHRSRAVQIAAQHALLRSESRSLHLLVEYLSGPHRAGTSLAIEVAASIGDPRLVVALESHLQAEKTDTRIMVARGLALGSAKEAADMLANMLADESAGVRAEAASSLGRLRAVNKASAIAQLLGDPSWDVRRNAALALDKIGPAGALLLRRALSTEDPFARDMARQVLEAAAARTRQPAPPTLEDLRATPDLLAA